MPTENLIFKVTFDTSQADKGISGIDKTIDSADKSMQDFNTTIQQGAKGLGDVAKAKKSFNDISLAESTNEVKQLTAELTNTLNKSKEFGQVTKQVQDAFKKGTIDEAQALKILEDAINKGVEATKKMKVETEQVVVKHKSLRAEIRELKEQLRDPSLTGEQYTKAQTKLAMLTDAMGDQQAQIKLLASDTRGLDTAMQGLGLGVGIFASLQGASALFGKENEDVQKALLKVNAAMSVLQGLSQIQNTLDKESGFVNSVKLYWADLTGKSLASQAVAQEILTGVTEVDTVAQEENIVAKEGNTIATTIYGYALTAVTAISRATGLSMAASWALATGGLTLLIAGVALLISNYDQLFGSTQKLLEIERARLDVSREVAKSNVEEKTTLEGLLLVAKDETIAKEKRVEAIKKINAISPEYLGNLTLENLSTEASTKAILNYIKALDSKSTAEAIQSKIVELKKKQIEEETKSLDDQATTMNKLKSALIFGLTGNKALSTASLIVDETKNLAKNTGEIKNQISAYQRLAYEKLKSGEITLDELFKSDKGNNSTPTITPDKVKVQPKDVKLDIAKAKVTIDKDLYDFAIEKLDNKAMADATSGRLTNAFSNYLNDNIKRQNDLIKNGNAHAEEEEKKRVDKLKKKLEEFDESYQAIIGNIKDADLRNIFDGLGKIGQTLADTTLKPKEQLKGILAGIQEISNSAFNIIDKNIDKNIANFDRLIDKQKSSIEYATKIAESGNTQLLQAETKKLAVLEDLRRKEQQKKKKAAITETIINTAVGVAQAFTQEFPLSIVLAALAAATGIAQIAIISSQQFKKGGQTPYGFIDAPSHEQGGGKFTIKGRKDYVGEYEGGEFIHDREYTANNIKELEYIHKNRINLKQFMMPTEINPILSTYHVNNFGELENRLKDVERAIIDLPKNMPRAQFNADIRGLSMRTQEIVNNENNWKR